MLSLLIVMVAHNENHKANESIERFGNFRGLPVSVHARLIDYHEGHEFGEGIDLDVRSILTCPWCTCCTLKVCTAHFDASPEEGRGIFRVRNDALLMKLPNEGQVRVLWSVSALKTDLTTPKGCHKYTISFFPCIVQNS